MVYLLRGDDSVADRAFTDEKGKYRFEVAGGTYRVEVDKDPGLRNDHTVPGFRSDKLKLKPGKIKHVSLPHPARRRRPRHRDRRWRPGRRRLPRRSSTRTSEFAAGVVTDAAGQYAVTSLEPGDYTVRTSAGFSDYVSQSKPVTLEQTVGQDRRPRARPRAPRSGSRRPTRPSPAATATSRPSCATRPAG